MKFDRIFLTLCFIFIAINCFSSVISSDVVTDVNVKQIGENIKITYKLSEKADITAYVSVDGGISYSPITEVSGDVGVDIKFGDKYIIWYVLRERDEFIYDNVCFKIVAKTEPKYSQKVKEYYQAQKEFDRQAYANMGGAARFFSGIGYTLGEIVSGIYTTIEGVVDFIPAILGLFGWKEARD
jgi:hypothetical protein